MPNLTVTNVNTGNQSWLVNTHGIYDTISAVLNGSKFTANSDGIIPSGTPVDFSALANVVPAAANTVALGFLYTDQDPSTGKINAAILPHGNILAANLPAAIPSGANTTHFTIL